MKLVYYILAGTGGAFVATVVWLLYFGWPWIVAVPWKLEPLKDYIVYDDEVQPSNRSAGIVVSVWRPPSSRSELFLARDYALKQPSKHRYPWVLQTGLVQKRPAPEPPLLVLKDDALVDFVVDSEESFGHPQSWDELNRAIGQRKVQRTSEFFARHPYEAKSFYGEIPREWCFREYETESGPHSQLQVWKNFALVNLYLNAPKSPAVFVVAASGASNAQVAACEPTRMDPVAYPGEQFWAVVFAGRGGSGPTQYLLDRATVEKNSARILVSHPPVSYSTADVHEYWFFIPLGRINEGDYPIEVRLAKDDSLIASAKSKLRYATEVEIDQRNTASSAKMATSNRHFEELRRQECKYGTELQLRLDRLAEFVAGANLSPGDQQLLSDDVAKLGAAVDWDRDIYGARRYGRRSLESPTPGKSVDLGQVNMEFVYPQVPYRQSDVPISDVWTYAGGDAQWYVSKTYRMDAELSNAMTASKPTELQEKVRAILGVIAAQASEPRQNKLRAVIAEGTIEDAVDMAFEAYVKEETPRKRFSSDGELWAVMTGAGSFLVRNVSVREYRDTRDSDPTREYRVHVSAYEPSADRHSDDREGLQGTLTLIPLGKQPAGFTIGVQYWCSSVCCRQVSNSANVPQLIDVRTQDMLYSQSFRGLGHGTFIRVEQANGDKP